MPSVAKGAGFAMLEREEENERAMVLITRQSGRRPVHAPCLMRQSWFLHTVT
jgi:hypothetical protein